MLSINSLLNPQPERQIPFSTSFTREKRQKMAKDAPVFRPGRIQGVCRYPPCEDRNPELERAHREFSMHPMGSIHIYPRHIPYASEKKSFQEKTGRDSFHVFQYTFRMPGEEKEWSVMWDYNIGIVRITHLFKCLGYSKTTPGKMLSQNPGLREICHSITGGALSAQGYWMPYEAAKAMAATFCWRLRYVLTPLFGTDFPAMCISPSDRKYYGRMTIPQEIVQHATKTANYYRSLEPNASKEFNPSALDEPSKTHNLFHMDLPSQGDSSLKLPPIKIPRLQYAEDSPGARDSSMEPYSMSPTSQSSFSNFTPINPPRSSDVPSLSRVQSPQSILRAISDVMRPENAPGGISEESDTDSDGSSNVYSTPKCPSIDGHMEVDKPGEIEGPSDAISDKGTRQSDNDDLTDSDDDWQGDDIDDEDYRGPPLKRSLSGHPIRKHRPTSSRSQVKKNPTRKSRAARSQQASPFAHEVKAAEALLHLHMHELDSAETQADVDRDGLASPFISPSLNGGASRSQKRRRASF